MKSKLRLLFNKLTADTKRLFLIDGLGAMLTAFLLFAVLSRFEDSFGMPRKTLNFLIAVACIYAVYSICCYLFVVNNWRIFLRAIAIANLLYCLLTVVFLFIHYDSLTVLGYTYFIVEMIVVGILIVVELSATTNNIIELRK